MTTAGEGWTGSADSPASATPTVENTSAGRGGQSSLMPCLRYRDAASAIDWLGRAFGFVPKAVYPDGAGGIAHAELTLGAGMVMLGSARDDEHGRHVGPPDPVAGRVTQAIYVVVPDADAAHVRAVACGATAVMPPTDQPYGSRDFSCRDPEGHLWSLGTYDPWTR